jgi:hypothetical protein
MTRVAKNGMISYSEIRALDVREFFIILVNLEKQMEEDKNGKG